MNWRHLISPVLHLYWRTFRPRTYGVRALILHPDTSDRILLVRHTYGDRMLWNLPGGGFNPKKEIAMQAAIREIKEELGADLINPIEICSYYTDAQGKCDTVTVVQGDVHTIRVEKYLNTVG
jgi:8-oxo-dGTP diphosphatase